MSVLIAAFGCFSCLVVIHIVCVRLRFMTLHLPALVLAALIGLACFSGFLFFHPAPLRFTSLLVYALLCLWYIAQCNALAYESPSLNILQFVDGQADGAATYDRLKELLSDEKLIFPRLEDLAAGGYVAMDGGRYVLQPKGRRIVRIIGAYRRLLRLGVGG